MASRSYVGNAASAGTLAEGSRTEMTTNPHLPTEILPGLYLGSRHVRAENGPFMASVTHLVDASNLPTGTLPEFSSGPWLRVEATDSSDSILPFDDVSAFIHRALSPSSSSTSTAPVCLVHCNQGMSRSPALVMAYLIEYERCTLREAFHRVKERRRMVLPNAGFMEQLIEVEKGVHNGVTTLELGLGGAFRWKC